MYVTLSERIYIYIYSFYACDHVSMPKILQRGHNFVTKILAISSYKNMQMLSIAKLLSEMRCCHLFE